jgi:hypothetical protein
MIQVFGTLGYYVAVVCFMVFNDAYRSLDPFQQKVYLAALVGLKATLDALVLLVRYRAIRLRADKSLSEHEFYTRNPKKYTDPIPFSKLEHELRAAEEFSDRLQFFKTAGYYRTEIAKLDQISSAIYYKDLLNPEMQ